MKNQKDADRQGFLQGTKHERLEEFKAYKVAHSRLLKVSDDVKSAIKYLDKGCFIFCVGPPGSGKTTALEGIYNSLLRDYLPQMELDPGLIPVIKVKTRAEYGRFDWKGHWRDCLVALDEPLIDYKILPRKIVIKGNNDSSTDTDLSGSGPVLRSSFETAAQNRGVVVCLKDEAHHFLHVPSGRMLRQQLEILKSVAERSGTIFALFGTYDLLSLRNMSGQLGRRTKTIHFSRYRPEIEEDINSFADATLTLLNHMPLPKRPTFSDKDVAICFEMSFGCVGLLKMILVATLNSALNASAKSISVQDVMGHELPVDILDQVSMEIIKGERRLEEEKIKRQKVKLRMTQGSAYLKSHPEDGLSSDEEYTEPELPEVQQDSSRRGKPGKRRRVERLPKRDPVGAGRRKSVA
jgi:energy-coupling factor transporter ATP-binding protein EcfA2